MFILKNKNNIIQTDLYYDLFMKYENKNVINEIEYVIRILISFLLAMKSNYLL